VTEGICQYNLRRFSPSIIKRIIETHPARSSSPCRATPSHTTSRAREAGFDLHLAKPLAIDSLEELLGAGSARL
jgi:hypothetical protein